MSKLSEDGESIISLIMRDEAMERINVRRGFEEGYKKEIKERKKSAAKEMLNDGLEIKKISQYIGLTEEEIKKLTKEES